MSSNATVKFSAPPYADFDAWIQDGFNHLKFMAYTKKTLPLFEMLGIDVDTDNGCTVLDSKAAISRFTEAAKSHRFWERYAKP